MKFTIQKNTGIKATATRKSDGWRGVLEYPNGGHQILVSRHGTMDSAIQDAKQALRIRLEFPTLTVKDPGENEYQDLEILTQ